MSAKELAPALAALDSLYARALERVRGAVTEGGKISASRLDDRQLAAHGLAYLKAEIEAARQMIAWAERLYAEAPASTAGDLEARMAAAYVGELCRGVQATITLGACEDLGVAELGLTARDVAETVGAPEVVAISDRFASGDAMIAIARDAHARGTFGAHGLFDDGLEAIEGEFRKFVQREVYPIAQDVHRKDVLIPIELLGKMADLGVFGLTIPEAYGGSGMGKVAMCVVTEELSRGYIGVGSLGTRSEIAGELILGGGTEEQKQEFLPQLAAGTLLSTAVFTEPNFGSDLAHIRTRAEKQANGGYRLFGQKTWITHATRADLMTVLARTNPKDDGYGGLSMFLARKTRSEHEAHWPDAGLTGTEIKVLGYRGMKEFELSFDGFEVAPGALLGGQEGMGFKQLMVTFESARIQTAARGVGVAQAALDEAMRYANDRVQFGKPIFAFPRVARKLGRMLVRTMAARQLTYFSAREKEADKRCDLEAGMAKLLATKAAWEAADATVQIHGGNGFAEEYVASRLLVDARVLSIFEGANEIQAHVVARRLLEEKSR